mmetsp:Transcript_365/g.464  ORF Transcript_365/g.464 Transcript_365/m.464 type:complete len:83 (-) Transcript_365:63-311(-)
MQNQRNLRKLTPQMTRKKEQKIQVMKWKMQMQRTKMMLSLYMYIYILQKHVLLDRAIECFLDCFTDVNQCPCSLYPDLFSCT